MTHLYTTDDGFWVTLSNDDEMKICCRQDHYHMSRYGAIILDSGEIAIIANRIVTRNLKGELAHLGQIYRIENAFSLRSWIEKQDNFIQFGGIWSSELEKAEELLDGYFVSAKSASIYDMLILARKDKE